MIPSVRVRSLLRPSLLGRLSTFRRGFVSTFSLDVVARGLSAIATILFIRGLSVSNFAYVVLFLNIGQFAGSALTGGIRMRYLRTEAERVSRGHQQPTGFAHAMAASLTLVVGIATVGAASMPLLGLGGPGGNGGQFVAITGAYTAGHASVELTMYHYQAHLKFTRAGAVGIARSAAILAVSAIAALGVMSAGTVVAATTALAVVTVAAFASAPLIWETIRTPATAAFGGEFGRESAWLTAYYLASAGFSYSDLFIVAALLSDSAVASYGAALRYISIVLGPMPALLAVTRVRASQRDLIDSTHLQITMLTRWIKRSILPVGAAIGLAALAAPIIIPIIDGGRYPDSIPIFQLMLLPALVGYATMPGSNLLIAQKRYRTLAIFYTVTLAVQLVAAVIIAKVSGVIGVAAVASCVSAVAAGAIAYLATRMPRKAQPMPEQVT